MKQVGSLIFIWALLGALQLPGLNVVSDSHAAEKPSETFNSTWPLLGLQAKTEVASLSEMGRVTFSKALVACSLYSDDYLNSGYKRSCEEKSKIFVLEFSEPSSYIDILFKLAKNMADLNALQKHLASEQQRSARAVPTADNEWRVYIEILEKAYRETRDVVR